MLPNRWYHIFYTYSGSMLPTFAAGDLIVITPPPARLLPGQVITLNVNGQLVTHRLLRIEADGRLVTKGDNNPAADDWGNLPVKYDRIVPLPHSLSWIFVQNYEHS